MPPLTRAEYDVVLLTASWLIGFAPLLVFRRRWTWIQCVGLALVASPFVRFGLGIYLSIDALFTYTVLAPAARDALWNGIQWRLFQDLVVPAVGVLLMHNAFPGFASRRAPRQGVADALASHGLAPKASWRRDATRGLALFFAIAIAYLAALALSRTVFAVLSFNGDESAYWRNLTIPLIVLLAASAGLTEEFLFRGILLRALSARMPWILAAAAQALLFAFIHAGYGTWLHVAGPFAFGLGMAWVAKELGVVPAALLHAQVNVLFFAIDVAPTYVATRGAMGGAALAVLLLALVVGGAWAVRATRGEPYKLLWASLVEAVRGLKRRTLGRSAA